MFGLDLVDILFILLLIVSAVVVIMFFKDKWYRYLLGVGVILLAFLGGFWKIKKQYDNSYGKLKGAEKDLKDLKKKVKEDKELNEVKKKTLTAEIKDMKESIKKDYNKVYTIDEEIAKLEKELGISK